MRSVEQAEELAQRLLHVANDLGGVMLEVDGDVRTGMSYVMEESEAYETLVLGGADVSHALRVLAMRLDRAALVRFEE